MVKYIKYKNYLKKYAIVRLSINNRKTLAQSNNTRINEVSQPIF